MCHTPLCAFIRVPENFGFYDEQVVFARSAGTLLYNAMRKGLKDIKKNFRCRIFTSLIISVYPF